MRFRLQTVKPAYPRASVWRTPLSVTAATAFTDDYPVGPRTTRNIRRLKGRRLRISPLRLGQRRAPQWRVVYGFPWVSDARPSEATRGVSKARAYAPRRVR